MGKKIFDPEQYGMVVCLICKGKGFVTEPKRQCCPKCGGFGFVKKEPEKDANIPTNND